MFVGYRRSGPGCGPLRCWPGSVKPEAIGKDRGRQMDFQLETSARDGWTVVTVSGEIDVSTAPRLRGLLLDLIQGGVRQLVVDLTWVEFIDSTGLGVLIGTFKRIRGHDGSLVLVMDDPRVRRIFEITCLDTIFTIHPTVDEVIR